MRSPRLWVHKATRRRRFDVGISNGRDSRVLESPLQLGPMAVHSLTCPVLACPESAAIPSTEGF